MFVSNIEVGTKLNISSEGLDLRFISILVGFKKDQFLIITPPKDFESIEDKLKPG